MVKSSVMIMVAAVAFSGYQEPGALKPFSSDAGRFKVSLPGEPKEASSTISTKAGPIKLTNVNVELADGVYMVIYSDYPETVTRAATPDGLLDTAMKGVVSGADGKLLTSKKITQNGFPGREFAYSLTGPGGPDDKGLARYRLVLVNGRQYQVVVMGKEAMAKSATADSFFGSFNFTPVPALAAKSAEMPATAKAAESTAAFQTFSSDAGRFAISMPGEPNKTEATVKTDVGNVKVVVFEVKNRDGDYTVGYSDYPPKVLTAANTDTGLANSQKGIVSSAKGTLMSSRKIKQDGFTGLDFTYSLKAAGVPGKALGRAHLVVVHNRLYQVLLIAASAKAKSAESDAFFDSFKFEAAPAAERPVAAATPRKAPARPTLAQRTGPSPRSRITNMPRGPAPRRTVTKGSEPAVDPSKWLAWTLDNKPAGVSVQVPSQPEKRDEAGILGAEKRDVFTWSVGDAEYTLRSQTLPEAALAGGPESVLDASRDALAKQIGGKVRNERKASLDNNPGREYQISAPALRGHVVRVRSVVVGSQLYEQYVSARRADVSGDAVGRFFDSFKLER